MKYSSSMSTSSMSTRGSSAARLKNRWLFGLTLLALMMAIVSAVAMMILVHPGDECLLFVSVRGEALIYGHPSGCNFITFSQIIGALGAGTLMLLLFCRKARSFLRGKKSHGSSVPSLTSSHTLERRRLARLYSTRTLVLAAIIGMLELSAAIVILSGYLVSCHELNYETRRQLYGRTTLGSLPVRNLDMACYSLFRDVDFHTRFHFDHYEYSGQWHGQYRGYRHGRVHHHAVQHSHAINVALALELSMGATWVAAITWFATLVLLLHLRFAKKRVRRKEEENSFVNPNNSLAMKNLETMSTASATSSGFLFANKMNNNPNGLVSNHVVIPSPAPSDSVSHCRLNNVSPMNTSVMVANSRPGKNNEVGEIESQQNNVQYVQMSNGVLVPMATLQLQQQQMVLQQQMQQMQQHLQLQQRHSGQQQLPVAGQQQPAVVQQRLVQQPYQVQYHQQQQQQQQQHVVQHQVPQVQQFAQLGVEQQQQVGVEQQQQPLVPQPLNVGHLGSQSLQAPSHGLQPQRGGHQSHPEVLRRHGVDDDDAQQLQLSLSQDFGLKCSQI